MRWWLIILIKIVVSRLPIPYHFWKASGLFQHGQMNSLSYSEKIFSMHFKHFSDQKCQSSFNMLELGPGDSALSGLYGYLNGAENTYLLDVGSFASRDMNIYRSAFETWCEHNELKRPQPDFSCFEKFLTSIHTHYCTNGLTDFKIIKDGSIDFSFSHSVLEHVRKADFNVLLEELYRVSKLGAISSHNIDYMDHLGGGQKNLKFSTAVWESDMFANSGFYTNRIPPHILHKKVRDSGFRILQEQFGSWPSGAMSLEEVHVDLRDVYNQELSAPTSSLKFSR